MAIANIDLTGYTQGGGTTKKPTSGLQLNLYTPKNTQAVTDLKNAAASLNVSAQPSVAKPTTTATTTNSASRTLSGANTRDLTGTTGATPSTTTNGGLVKNSIANAVTGGTVPTTVTPTGGTGATGGSGSGGSVASTPTTNNFYQQLADYYREQNENARQQSINAIETALKTNVGMYDSQIPLVNQQYDNLLSQNNANYEQLIKDNAHNYGNALSANQAKYDNLVDQNEVNRYRTQASVREALANRGQLDSGLGRQEMLNVGSTYGRNLNNIQLERESNANNLMYQRDANDSNLKREQANNNSNIALEKQSTLSNIQNAIAQLNAEAETNKATVNNNYAQALAEWVAKQQALVK